MAGGASFERGHQARVIKSSSPSCDDEASNKSDHPDEGTPRAGVNGFPWDASFSGVISRVPIALMFRHTEDETKLHGGKPLLERGHPSSSYKD